MNAVLNLGTTRMDPQARRWALSVALVLTFMLLALIASGANLGVFRAINGMAMPAGDWFWSNVTVLGDTTILLCLLLPFVGRRPALVWSITVAVVLVSLMVHIAKMMLELPRPPAVLSSAEMHLIGFLASTGSFPSGHTAAAFVFAGGICLLPFRTWVKALVLVMASLIGVSRIAVGIHWPLDVLGGALIGWVGIGVSVWLALRWPVGLSLRAQRATAFLLILVALATSVLHDGGYPQARPLLVLLPLVTLMLALPGLRRLYTGDKR